MSGEKKAMKAEDVRAEQPKEETPMVDMTGFVDVPDIPLPSEEVEETGNVEDECTTAFKWCFVGAGQAGARMVESFYKLGYRRVCAINTTHQDLAKIDIPDANKFVMDIGAGGAGKDPQKGLEAITRYYEDVHDLMLRSFGTHFDRILVCAGAGGGTGTGSFQTLVRIAHDIAQSVKAEQRGGVPVVGGLLSCPMSGEGQKVNANAHTLLIELENSVGAHEGKLASRRLSPFIIVDNERISQIYPGLPVTKFWLVANQSITSLFHLFNSIAVQDSEFTTFDEADYKDILQSGIVTFGATVLRKFGDPTDISHAIRDNLRRNILVSGMDISKGQKGACVIIGHPQVLDEIPQQHLEHGFEMLTRMMQRNSTVHRGIYKGMVTDSAGKPALRAYTILGELGLPKDRLNEMNRIASGTRG